MIRPFWRRSTVLFLVLSLTLIAIKLLPDVFLTDLPLRDQAAAFTWTLVLAIIASVSWDYWLIVRPDFPIR